MPIRSGAKTTSFLCEHQGSPKGLRDADVFLGAAQRANRRQMRALPPVFHVCEGHGSHVSMRSVRARRRQFKKRRQLAAARNCGIGLSSSNALVNAMPTRAHFAPDKQAAGFRFCGPAPSRTSRLGPTNGSGFNLSESTKPASCRGLRCSRSLTDHHPPRDDSARPAQSAPSPANWGRVIEPFREDENGSGSHCHNVPARQQQQQ